MAENIFREAKQLLNTKSPEEMSYEEVLTVKAAMIPINLLHQFENRTILEGLEDLAKIFNGEE